MSLFDPPQLWMILGGDIALMILLVLTDWLVLHRLQTIASTLLQRSHDVEAAKTTALAVFVESQDIERQKIAAAVARELQINAARIKQDVLSVAATVQDNVILTNGEVMEALEHAAADRIKLHAVIEKFFEKKV